MSEKKFVAWYDHDIHFKEVDGVWYASLKDVADALDISEERVRLVADNNLMRGNDYISEECIYQIMTSIHHPLANKFKTWTFRTLSKLRKMVGLQPWEVMRMFDDDIQEDIDNILDTLYWDEEKKCVMQSVTVQGGDVEQVPFE